MFQQESLLTVTDKLNKFALRLTRNPHNAEDLVQSTLVRAIEKSDSFEDGTNLFSWTSKIMFNIFASNYRRSKKFDTQYDPSSYIDQMSVEPSQELTTDLNMVSQAMQHLQAEHREILTLICVNGMRYEEASQLLQLPIGTIRSRLSRARNQLKHILSLPRANFIPTAGERMAANDHTAALRTTMLH